MRNPLAYLVFFVRLILRHNLFTALVSDGEECWWLRAFLMSRGRAAFTPAVLPNHCNAEAYAEPKCNIALAAENDFSSKLVHVSYRDNLRLLL